MISKTERDVRERALAGMARFNKSKNRLEILSDLNKLVDVKSLIVLEHITGQDYDYYRFLINSSLVVTFDSDRNPSIRDVCDVSIYRRKLKKNEQIKLKVALTLSEET